MNLPTKPIESATIGFSGDPSVGIAAQTFTMSMFLDLSAFGDPKEMLDHTRGCIEELYSDMHGEKCQVMFDFEIEEQEKRLREMEEEDVQSKADEEMNSLLTNFPPQRNT